MKPTQILIKLYLFYCEGETHNVYSSVRSFNFLSDIVKILKARILTYCVRRTFVLCVECADSDSDFTSNFRNPHTPTTAACHRPLANSPQRIPASAQWRK